ncbi:MAG: hypothetical protein CMO98_07515 [Woeseia sp.]|nr:hypothetical protein [Woeseia sp.]
MSARFNHLWLIVPFLVFSPQLWSLGLGDIRLHSALNQPLQAEIELITAMPQELDNLTIELASNETFSRYDLPRPILLTRFAFEVVKSGAADSNFVRVTSTEPVTEPFVTFLVEAAWAGGRLLREYTLLLDPPIFVPPPELQQATVDLPVRSDSENKGAIESATSTPQKNSTNSSESRNMPGPYTEAGFNTVDDDQYLIQSGDTLWGITQRFLPDSRITSQQAMLAIYEANKDAFDGNINEMRAGATLTIPSADDVFRISRAEAFNEIDTQNNSWIDETAVSDMGGVTQPQPSLTLVPPDEEEAIELGETSINTGLMVIPGEPATNPIPTQVEDRLLQIDAILLELDALIEIPDNELASLRRDLAALSGTTATVEEEDGELFLENQIPETQLIEDDVVSVEGDDITSTEYESEPIVDDAPAVVARVSKDEGIFEILLSKVSNFSVWIGMALLMSLATLMWFMRRAARRHKEQITLGLDELDAKSDETPHPVIVTEKSEPAVPEDEDTIVVVETELAEKPHPPDLDDTQEVPIIQDASALALSAIKEETETSSDGSFDFTNMNEAIGAPVSNSKTLNLDQNDPVAEAEFHMAYGLYDQATDLINEALSKDPDRTDLLAKLCEIYFVWGNRDAFIEVAVRLQSLVGTESNAEWDKIKIMGHQIAADHEMFGGDITDDHADLIESSPDGDFEEDFDLAADINLEEYEIKADGIGDFDMEGEHQVSDLDSFLNEDTDDGQTLESSVRDIPTLEIPLQESAQTSSFDSGEELDLDDLGIDLNLEGQPLSVEENNNDDNGTESDVLSEDRSLQPSEYKENVVEQADYFVPVVGKDTNDTEEDFVDNDDMLEVGTKLDLARAYVDMGDPIGARSILEEVLAEGNEEQKEQAQRLIDSLPS